ncbi:lysis system i-spanin subunit Rz [Pseudomonas costantinii]|uniref:Bacteriophage Rz lysis protein n=1 Tax=Pseudomonas costantinii TaxID=168469 RepID=A0A1H4U292_9PSED|nr:lysis system i-spanin subunit Rz [Pseudomonas costantinii]SEC62374.1 Bacteriophage Rz lysis protein [Pseudomonas costantinii]
MSVLDLIPPAVRPWAFVLIVLLIAGAGAAGAWVVQDWRYGNELSKQDAKAAQKAQRLAEASAGQLNQEQAQRLALESRLKTNDVTHYKELSDGKKAQQRLSDRLATADVRLSVLLAAGVARPGSDGVSAAASAGGLDHGAARAELDPAHAQRIVGITGDGDEGLIALAACQGWAREVLSTGKALPP